MREYTAQDVQIGRHEVCHAVATYVLWGPKGVGGITRVSDDRRLGAAHVGELPVGRDPALNAADGAVIAFAPLADNLIHNLDAPVDSSDIDMAIVEDMAEIAWRYAPERDRDTDFEAEWMHRVHERANVLVSSSRFTQLRRALETALQRKATMTADDVLVILKFADQT